MALIEMDYYSDALSKMTHLEVILPCNDGWTDAEKPFKTLYLISDCESNSKETSSLFGLRLQSMLKGIAVVAMDCEKHLCEEVVEVTRETFPLSTQKKDTFIGAVAGGKEEALEVYQSKDLFEKMVCLSWDFEHSEAEVDAIFSSLKE